MNKLYWMLMAACCSGLLAMGQNVGIGTATPNTELHIAGGPAANKRIQLTHAGTGTTLTDGLLLGINNTGGAFITQNEAQPLILGTTGLQRMLIDAQGRVAVGTNTPFTFSNFTAADALGNGVAVYGESNNSGNASFYINALNSAANAGVGFMRTNTLRGYIGFNSGNDFFLNVGSFNNVLFASSLSGAVGIGTVTTATGVRLDVNGIAKANTVMIGTGGALGDLLIKRDEQGTVGFRKGHFGLALRYIICVNGAFPTRSTGNNGADAFLGEIRLFAGVFPPSGWEFCEGQSIAITSNSSLFAILGTTYGGNGISTFALPDLRGTVPVGVGRSSTTIPFWDQGERSN